MPSGSRLVARMARRRAGAQQRLGQRGARLDQVLAVVEHQQQASSARAQAISRLGEWAGRAASGSAERGRDRLGRRGPGRPAAPARPARRRRGSRPAPPRATSSASRVLPTPPAPVSVSSRVVAQQPPHLGQLALAPDEAGQRRRQVGGRPRRRRDRGRDRRGHGVAVGAGAAVGSAPRTAWRSVPAPWPSAAGPPSGRARAGSAARRRSPGRAAGWPRPAPRPGRAPAPRATAGTAGWPGRSGRPARSSASAPGAPPRAPARSSAPAAAPRSPGRARRRRWWRSASPSSSATWLWRRLSRRRSVHSS